VSSDYRPASEESAPVEGGPHFVPAPPSTGRNGSGIEGAQPQAEHTPPQAAQPHTPYEAAPNGYAPTQPVPPYAVDTPLDGSYGHASEPTEPLPDYYGEAPPLGPDGLPLAEPQPVVPERSSGSVIREVLETVVLAVLIFLAVRAVVQNFKVEGSSMVPSFLDGEYMLVNKAVYTRIDTNAIGKVLSFVHSGANAERYIFHGPARGDVIVFHPPPVAGGDKKDFIKRVIGVPGDKIDFRDNHVFVNGLQVVEPYITAPTNCQGQFCHVVLQKDQFFAMGDNRTNSSDSRFWGPVSASKIIGKALLIYWCGGRECKQGTDHIGLAPNHSPALAAPSIPIPPIP